MPSSIRSWILFAFTYFACAELGHWLSFPGSFASLWPPSGLFLAVLLVVERRQWPGFIVTALLVSLVSNPLHGKTLLVSLGFGTTNCIEAVVGALAIQHFSPRGFTLTSLRHTLTLVLFPACVSSPIGATLGAATSSLGLGTSFWSAWPLWWSSTLLGCLVMAPPVLVALTEGGPKLKHLRIRPLLEAIALSALLLLTTEYIFAHQSQALAWAVVPALLLTTLRYHTRGVVLAHVLVAGIAARHTAHGLGPFGAEAIEVRLLLVQSFIGIMSISFLAMATVVRERHLGAEQLDQYRQNLETANAELLRLSRTDGLTGVNNRLALQDRLQEELAFAELDEYAFSVILLDVDHFKSFNDTFGHPEGDSVLKRVAQIMQDSVRKRTDFVARYGGEEFAILLPSIEAEDAVAVAENLRVRIEQEPWIHRKVTVSIGVSTLSAETPEGASLLRAADDALYASKHAGRNCVHHINQLRHSDAPLMKAG